MLKVTAVITCDEVLCKNVEPVDLEVNQHFLRAEYESDLEDEGWYFTKDKHYCPGCAHLHRSEDLDFAYDQEKDRKMMEAWDAEHH